MPRQSLGALLGNVEDKAAAPASTPQPELPPADAHADAVQQVGKPAPSTSDPLPKHASPRAPEPVNAEPASYLRFVRKETRLREDQQNQLTLHARRLNRQKAAGTPRITDNSLIRIAVDLLLARIENAVGDNEASLLESLK